MTERVLVEGRVTQYELWAQAADELMAAEDEGMTLGEQKDIYADALATAVVRQEMTVEQLREHTQEINAWHRTVLKVSGGAREGLEDFEDYREATATTIAHMATSRALGLVDTVSGYNNYLRRSARAEARSEAQEARAAAGRAAITQSRAGMGWLERHELAAVRKG